MKQQPVNVLRLAIFSKWRRSFAVSRKGECHSWHKGVAEIALVGGQHYHFPESLILLLSAYAKNQQEDMDAAEKTILKAAVEQFFEE